MRRFTARSASVLSCALESLESRTLLAVIDLMALYSTDATASLGGEASAQRAIRQSIDIANLAHQNTGDGIVLRLVHIGPIAYTSSGSLDTDLDRLQNSSDGHLDAVHALRDTYGADLVALVSNSPGGGLAGLLTDPAGNPDVAFSANSPAAVGPANLVLAHELGHNMGSDHNREDGGGVFPAYSFGYHAEGTNGVHYKDVMSYGDYVSVPVFATPTFTHQGAVLGKPVGDPNAADLKTAFAATGPVIAAYRPTVVADAAPRASLWQSDWVGNELLLKVRYIDDIALNAATFDNSDIVVTTPEGFAVPAQFVSADVAGNGYARLVTYKATITSNPVNRNNFIITLQAGQVRDTNNQAVAAGVVGPDLEDDLDGGEVMSTNAGPLAPNSVRRHVGVIGQYNDPLDIFKFTVESNMSLTATLTGIGGALTSTVPWLGVYKDANGNERRDDGNPAEDMLFVTGSGLADRELVAALTPGTYYMQVYSDVNQPSPTTNYTLTIGTSAPVAGDTAPPTALANKADTAAPPELARWSVLYRDDNGLDLGTLSQAKVEIGLSGPVGTDPFAIDPWIIKVLDAKTAVITYEINFGGPLPDDTVVTLAVPASSGLKDSAGNSIVPGPLGSYTVMPDALDTTAPTASLMSGQSLMDPAKYRFSVLYNDDRGIATATLGTGDVVVTGPGGFSVSATFESQAELTPGVGSMRVATYFFAPPGGSWDGPDDGLYTITMASNQVSDLSGTFVSPGSIGQFEIEIPGATAVTSPALMYNGNWAVLPGADNDAAAAEDNLLRLTDNRNGQTSSVFTRDLLNVTTAGKGPGGTAGFTTTFTFSVPERSGAPADGFTFVLQRGAATAMGNPGGGLGYVGMADSIAIEFDFYFSQNRIGVYANGADLSVDPGSSLATGLGLYGGTAFNVTIAYDDGADSLAVTVADAAAPSSTFTHVFTNAQTPGGSMSALDVAGLIGGSTARFGFTGATGGENAEILIRNWTINGTAVHFTKPRMGDADQDGDVDADDYFQIDAGFIGQTASWGHGDFNFDHRIDIDDYYLIDQAYALPSGPLAASASPSPLGTIEQGLFGSTPIDDNEAFDLDITNLN